MFLWEKEYCDQGLFVLNIYEIFNKSSSYAYFVDLYDMWHSRLGHVNHLCVMELQRLWLINMHDKKVDEKINGC